MFYNVFILDEEWGNTQDHLGMIHRCKWNCNLTQDHQALLKEKKTVRG